MKKIIALLMSLILILGLYACNSVSAPGLDETVASTETSIPTTEPTVPTTEPTAPTVEPTKNTEPTWHLQEVADKLNKYAIEFEWNDGVVDIILSVGLPDLDMFDRVERINVTAYLIYLSDNTSYRMVLDAGSGDVVDIVNNVDSPTENDSYYKG